MLTYSITVILCIVCSSSKVHANDNIQGEEKFDDAFLYKKYMEMDKQLKQVVDQSVKFLLPFAMKGSETVNISSTCGGDLLQLVSGLRRLQIWAISFADASGKLPDGLLSGNSHMLGNYDQCLKSMSPERKGTPAFQGQYCLISYKPILPNAKDYPINKVRLQKVMTIGSNASELLMFYLQKSVLMDYYEDNFGLCVPSGCGKKDIDRIMKYVAGVINMDLTVQYCHTEENVSFLNKGRIVIMCVFVLLGLLAVIGTCTEYYSKSKNIILKNLGARILLCFSITTNFPKLIDANTSNTSLRCLHGIRTLSLFYIILGHHYFAMNLFYEQSNVFSKMMGFGDFFPQIVLNGFLTVDIFFFLSGFLNIYVRMKATEAEKRIPNAAMIIIHRLWRIYPAYVFTILIFILMQARGPLGPLLQEKYVNRCTTDWWQNILFINNFFDVLKMCLPHSWHISCDMQLFLLSLITIPILLKKPKIGLVVNSAIMACALLFNVLWCWTYNLPPTFLFVALQLKDLVATSQAYIAPFTHVAPYYIGIMMGYLLCVKKDIKIPKLCQYIGWPIAGLLFTSMLFMTQRWNSGGEYSRLGSALYFAFSKPLYILGVAWMVFCCTTGHGGIINYILSLKIWIPFSRISFMTYLVSWIVQMFYHANRRTTTDAHNMIIIWQYIGDVTVSCLLALVLVLLAESPFIALGKILFQKNSTENTDTSTDFGKENENSSVQENSFKLS